MLGSRKANATVGTQVGRDVLEIVLYSSPMWIGSAFFAGLVATERPFLFLPGGGLIGLTISIVFGRRSSVAHRVPTWPIPEGLADQVTTAVAYNTTLLLGSVLGGFVWLATDSWFGAMILAVGAPVWFLHHIRFLIYEL